MYGAVVYLSEKDETSTENTSGAFAGAAQPRQRRRVPSAAHQTEEEHREQATEELRGRSHGERSSERGDDGRGAPSEALRRGHVREEEHTS